MGGSHGIASLNTPLPLDQNPFGNMKFTFWDMLYFLNLSWLMNDPILYNPSWLPVLTKFPTDIPMFDGNLLEDLTTHITTYHLWCVSKYILDENI